MPLDREHERQVIVECQAARRQEQSAAFELPFGFLYKGHYAGVMAISGRITRRPQDAEEVTNDAFNDLNGNILLVDPDMGCFGLLRLFAIRRAAEKYARVPREESFDPDKHPEPVADIRSIEERLIERTEAKIRLSKADLLARIVCRREAGAPNERMIFLFCRTLAYKPARVVEAKFSERKLGVDCELNGTPLAAIEPELEQEWTRKSDLQPDLISKMFEPLRSDMDVLLCAYPLHGRTKKSYGNTPIWRLPISQGRLREYFRTEPPTEDIRMWCVNVEKRVVKLARKKAARGKGALTAKER